MGPIFCMKESCNKSLPLLLLLLLLLTVERGSWGVLRMLEDCLRSLLRPPPRRDQQDRGGVASPTHSPSGSGTSDEQDKTPECDPRRCRLEWNQDDRAPVGGASVVTLHVSISYLVLNKILSTHYV